MKIKLAYMNRLGALALILALAPICWPACADDKNIPIVGTWQVTSFVLLELGTNKTSLPFGENPSGYIQYSPGGHMVVFLQSGNPKRPANFPYTDADRADAHRSIFGAYAGKYTVEGDKVVHHIVASWRPDWNGTDQTRYFTLEGNKLTIKPAPQKSTVAAGETVATLTFERVE
jgi:Lipocalin-like domain